MRTASGLFRRLAPRPESGTLEHMAIQRMEHVGIVVDDLAAATEFFVELGLELRGQGPVEGRWVGRVVGLVGEVERYEDTYRLCLRRGPEGIIVELAEQIG